MAGGGGVSVVSFVSFPYRRAASRDCCTAGSIRNINSPSTTAPSRHPSAVFGTLLFIDTTSQNTRARTDAIVIRTAIAYGRAFDASNAIPGHSTNASTAIRPSSRSRSRVARRKSK